MNKKTLFITIALTTALGASLTLPTTASAHEVVREKTVKVIRYVEDHNDHHRHKDADRWYHERHREAKSRWAPHNYHDKHDKHHKKYVKKHRHDHDRYERVQREYREYRPVEQQRVYRRHDNDSLRISVGYDIVL